MALTISVEFGKLNLSAGLYVTISTTIKSTLSPLLGAGRPTGHTDLRTQDSRKRWAFLCLGVAISPRQTIDRTAPQKRTEYKNPENRPLPGVNSLHTHIEARVAFDTRTKARSDWPTIRAAAQQSGFPCQDIREENARQVWTESQSSYGERHLEGICGGHGRSVSRLHQEA